MIEMTKTHLELNSAQKEAVKTTEGPVMAIAGAGSGKTNVLTKRIAHLILDLGVPKEQILAITFTNKAANEMKSRIASQLGMSYPQTYDMWISTFHAMCARILRQHIEYLGYDKNFQIIDDDDVTQMIKSIQRELGIDQKLVSAQKLKPHILKLKTDESQLKHFEDGPIKKFLEAIYPRYQKRLKDNNLVDFEDLLLLTIKLLKNQKEVKALYQEQFQYILVDEFQDTNNLQYELIKNLANKKKNVFIVGDEDQSIYAFRGANIENIRKFKRDFPNPRIILLEENYRSTNTILKAANQVIRSNKNRIEKNLFSKKGDGAPITLFKGFDHRDEVEYVVESIQRLLRKGYRYQDMAILYRTNNMSRVFEDVLMQKRLPYKIVGNLSFFKRKEIKDMVAYLRLLINPRDSYSFLRIVNEPRRGIGAKTVDVLRDFASSYDFPLFDAIGDSRCPLNKGQMAKLVKFKKMIESLSTSLMRVDFNTLMDDLLIESGYKKALEEDEMGDVRFENILELKTMFKESEHSQKTQDPKTLLTYILEDISLKSQEDETTDPNAITLMTVHAAKGLEFKVVFIVGAEQSLFPLYRTIGNPKEIEEERRLMYVGITRAMEKLYLTNAKQRRLYGEMTSNPDSIFIQDIEDNLIKFEGLAKDNKFNAERFKKDARPSMTFKQRQKTYQTHQNNDIKSGDKVKHKVFGNGVVVNVSDNQCQIAFSSDYGIKTLMKDHPAIEKIEG